MPVEVRQLNFSYMPGTPFEVKALADVSLVIGDGEFVGIIGHTGCGKSTLIQQMAGLVKPDSGQVLVGGQDINADGYDRKVLRRTVGVVFQYPEYQLFEETVGQDVAFGPKKAGMTESEIQKNVDTALELVGFVPDEIKHVSPFELSGGQKRKVAIAGVLATDPRVLILDEPISGLDPLAREAFMQLIKKLNAAGVTIIMISHNMDGLCDYASRVVAMSEGKVVLDGTPKEVFADIGRLGAIGLSASEARKAAYMLKTRGFEIPDDIITIDELTSFLIAALKPGEQ
ncbi:MAG TPA: energy-coupling factor transporter ATPase [Clostridiales bacterium]|nr:energy-coupling factor transporter ATPase [Clostridiales bacterium]